MTKDTSKEIIENAEEIVERSSSRPISLEEFIDKLIEDPTIGRTSHQYLLDAIESFGTRNVFENGEERERYVFFDDPKNNGEHAVLGNTQTLNRFVSDLRVIANNDERMKKIILFSGPTATGKSELKRCIVNGLKEYSMTDEGVRYTVEWSSTTQSEMSEMMYSDMRDVSETSENWKQSPVQVTPLAVLPQEVREQLARQFGDMQISDVGLDPFSQKEYGVISEHYENESSSTFRSATNPSHLRVKRYTLDRTQGIGVLASEDSGSVKERLLGSWMPSMLRELDSVGEKDPRAFSYDGVLSQGNSGVSIVEDATQHIDLLHNLLNIPDEGYAKIDKELGFDIDTVPIFISNPEILEQFNNNPMKSSANPERAIKRRTLQYSIDYLTGLSNEAHLLRKEISGTRGDPAEYKSDSATSMEYAGCELAPHTIEAVAMYDVISRLEEFDESTDLNLTHKALLYDRGYVEVDGERREIDEFEFQKNESNRDGKFGIPVTYSRDTISNLIHSSDQSVFFPTEIIDYLSDNLDSAPVFSEKQVKAFTDRTDFVKEYIYEQQEEDIIQAILYERRATESSVSEYVDNLYSWEDSGEYDEYLLKDFEIKHLGLSENDYDGQTANEDVEKFRREHIIAPLNRYYWQERDNISDPTELDLTQISAFSSILGEYSWKDVFTTYPNINPYNWEDPPENTRTEEIKQQCIEKLIEIYGYTEESATQTAERVFKRRESDLDEIKSNVAEE